MGVLRGPMSPSALARCTVRSLQRRWMAASGGELSKQPSHTGSCPMSTSGSLNAELIQVRRNGSQGGATLHPGVPQHFAQLLGTLLTKEMDDVRRGATHETR